MQHTMYEHEARLADGSGVTRGALAPFECVTSAAGGSNALATLARRAGKTLPALLRRLDRTIAAHCDNDCTTDEVNAADD